VHAEYGNNGDENIFMSAVGLSPQKPRSVHVRFLMDKVTLRQDFLRVLQFFPVNIVPPGFHISLEGEKGLLEATGQRQSQPINMNNMGIH
jgi:hypothetical protein